MFTVFFFSIPISPLGPLSSFSPSVLHHTLRSPLLSRSFSKLPFHFPSNTISHSHITSLILWRHGRCKWKRRERVLVWRKGMPWIEQMESGSWGDCYQSGVNPATTVYGDKPRSKLDWLIDLFKPFLMMMMTLGYNLTCNTPIFDNIRKRLAANVQKQKLKWIVLTSIHLLIWRGFISPKPGSQNSFWIIHV